MPKWGKSQYLFSQEAEAWNADTALQGFDVVAKTMGELVTEGKIRYWGIDLSGLEAKCDGKHEHKPWGLIRGTNEFATAEERRYPRVLCRRIARKEAGLLGSSVVPKSKPAIPEERTFNVGQSRRGPPGVIPEFHSTRIFTECSEANVAFLTDKNEISDKLDIDSIDVGLVFSKGFSRDSNFIRQVDCYYNSMQNSNSLNLIVDVLNDYEEDMIAVNADSLGLDESVFNPVSINKNNSFSVFIMIDKILNQVKGVSAGIINFLFVMFVVWLLRSLILRVEGGESSSFVYNLMFIFAASLMAMTLVFIGFQSGINNNSQGIIKSLIFGIQQLLQWKKVSAVFWLWLPTWLFVIGTLGCLASLAKTYVKAYAYTFWGAVLIHLVAIAGLFPIEKISLVQAVIPIYNIFGIGQLTLKEALISSDWWIAFTAISLCALFVNFLWYKIKKRSDQKSKSKAI